MKEVNLFYYCSYIGNIIEKGLHQILESEKFKELSLHNVDTNPKCKNCELKYLCGCAYRAWGGNSTKYSLDAPLSECDRLKQRARNLYDQSLVYLNIL